jgi:hypothetical protein
LSAEHTKATQCVMCNTSSKVAYMSELESDILVQAELKYRQI